MKRRLKLLLASLASLAVLVLMFMWLTGNLSGEEKIRPGKLPVKEESAADLETLVVSQVSIPIEIEAVGTVMARDMVEISSKLMATITNIAVDAGDIVKRGQTLVELDSRDAEARLAQTREALASAEAAFEKASLDAGRIERLYEKQAATKQEHDQVQAASRMAKASVEAAKAMVREAEINLSYAKIDSPISGKVIDRMADVGDMAAPGQPLISVYDPSTLRLEVSVGEHLRPLLRVGESANVSIAAMGKDFKSKITEIVPASDASSRSFIARVAVEEGGIYPGMYGKMRFSSGSRRAILIPPNALHRVGQLEMVTVVESGNVRTRAVKTGKTYPGGVEIISGLAPGEVIALPKVK